VGGSPDPPPPQHARAQISVCVMKMSVFYDIALFSLLEIYRRFRGILCLHNLVIVLMMEAIGTEKHQSVSPYYMTQHPRRHSLHANHHENLKSHNMFCVYVLSTSYVQRLVLIKARYYLDLFLYPLCPDRLWGPPSLLYNGYRGSFPQGYSAAGAWCWPLTPI
jgi:hypothetical protein